MEPFLVGFGASGVGFGAAMRGSEPLMRGSEVSFANNGVWRSEMWGSWPPSPPTLLVPILHSLVFLLATSEIPSESCSQKLYKPVTPSDSPQYYCYFHIVKIL